MLCGDECESVCHVLLECPTIIMNSSDKASFVLGSELWEEYFESFLALVKEYIIETWEERKSTLYGDNDCAHQPGTQSPTGYLGDIVGWNGK